MITVKQCREHAALFVDDDNNLYRLHNIRVSNCRVFIGQDDYNRGVYLDISDGNDDTVAELRGDVTIDVDAFNNLYFPAYTSGVQCIHGRYFSYYRDTITGTYIVTEYSDTQRIVAIWSSLTREAVRSIIGVYPEY